jgi:hypothetical protein
LGLKKSMDNCVKGWFPKETNIAYVNRSLKPRWRKPQWVAFTLVAVIALAFASYAGVQTYMRYSNPRLDVTASYYEKSLNCTTANVGDIIEVSVLVGWHGYVIPEFKREVKIVDPFPDSNFELVSGNNTYQYSGMGGGDQFTYQLRVISDGTATHLDLPKPLLYLDGSEILLTGTSAVLELRTDSEAES